MQRLAFLALIAGLTGCTASTDTTEVGVRTVLFSPLGGTGVQADPYPPGGVYFFPRFLSEWHTFDVAIQNLSMVADHSQGSRSGDDSLHFKTIDGNDISVDVTISWTIAANKAAYVAQFVGQDRQQVEDKLMRPVARTVVRDVLNRLTSEEYYQADRRFYMANYARDRLNAVLEQEGVRVDQVLLGEHSFNETYEQMIKDKKVADQEAERLVSETEAVIEERRRDMEQAKGDVSRGIAEAKGYAARRVIEADAIFYERTKEAEAIRVEERAKADALIEAARAVAGSGGRNMVKLEIAKHLMGKRIIFLPAGSGVDFRSMDMNKFLSTYGTKALNEK